METTLKHRKKLRVSAKLRRPQPSPMVTKRSLPLRVKYDCCEILQLDVEQFKERRGRDMLLREE